MKIEKTVWFSGFNIPGLIGIVMGVDEVTGKKKAYMGFGGGFNEKFDEKVIATSGSPVNVAVLQEVIDYLKSK